MPGPINRPPAMTPLPGLPTPGEADTATRAGESRATGPSNAELLRSADHLAETRRSTGPLGAEHTRGTAGLARVSGSAQTPAIVADPVALMGQLESAELAVNLPLKSSADLGRWISIREGTQAHLNLVIKDGKIDFANTKFEIRDEEGKDYSLDGPLWLDPEAVYIDEDGQLRAKMPCFPDPNITKALLGPDTDKVPNDPGEFLKKVTQGKDVAFEVMPSRQIGGTESTRPSGPSTASGVEATESSDNPLDAFTNLRDLNVSFEGTLKPGPLKLGPGATLNVAEGARVSAAGTMSDMDVDIEAPVKSMSLMEGKTRIQSGAGEVSMSVKFEDSESGGTALALDLQEFKLKQLQVQAPGMGDAIHQLSMGELSLAGSPEAPLISMRNKPGEAPALRVAMESFAMNDLSGRLVVEDTQGRPVELSLGRRVAGATDSMDVEGSLRLDSARGEFELRADAESVVAEVGQLGLVETGGFDLTLAQGRISGGGILEVSHRDGQSRMNLEAREGESWTIATRLQDAQLGAELGDTKVLADLNAATEGTISVSKLDLSNQAPPVLEAAASFKVGLDSLELPLGPHDTFRLKEGTEGTLTISELSWIEGDKSPKVDAELRLSVGSDALLKPGKIPGLEGAKVELDVDTGDTVLVLGAQLSRTGELILDCGFRLKDVNLKTDLRRGDPTVIPLGTLPAEPLGPIIPVAMAPVRELVPNDDLLALPSTDASVSIPVPPGVTIYPKDTFGLLDQATLGLRLPLESMRQLRVATYDDTETVYRLGIADKVGAHVDVDFTRAAGPLEGNLNLVDGRLEVEGSRLVLDPPLEIDIAAQYFMPGPLEPSTSLRATVRALELRETSDGKVRFWPVVDLDGLLPGAAEAVGLGDTIRRMIGDQIGKAMVGTSPFDGTLESVLGGLSSKVDMLRQPITIEPLASTEAGEVPPAPTAPSTPPDESLSVELDALLEKVRFSDLELSVQNASFSGKTLALGNGQSIQFGDDSELSVEGTPDNFTIQGLARLGTTQLGDDSLGLSLREGNAQVAVHVSRDANGDPRFELELTELEGRSLALKAKVGGLANRLDVHSVENASVKVSYAPGVDPVFEVNLPSVKADIVSDGSIRSGDKGGDLNLQGTVAGTIAFRDGQLSGDVEDISLNAVARGAMASGPLGPQGAATQLQLTGKGSFRTDADGKVYFRSAEGSQSMKLDAVVREAHGGEVSLSDAHVDSVAFGVSEADIEVEGIRGRLSGVLAIPGQDEAGSPEARIDIRSAELDGGGLRIQGGVFGTSEALQVAKLDASVVDLTTLGNDYTSIGLAQIDLEGRGTLALATDGGVNLESADADPFRAKARLSESSMVTKSPQFELSFKEGAQLSGSMHHLRFDPSHSKPSADILFQDVTMDAELSEGSVRVGEDGSAVSTLNLSKGTRVQAVLSEFGFVSGEAVANPDLSLNENPTDVLISGNLRLEGALAAARELAPDALARGLDRLDELEVDRSAFKLEKVESDGTVRIIVGVQADAGESFVARSHTEIDGGFSTRLRTELDPAGMVRDALRKKEGDLSSE